MNQHDQSTSQLHHQYTNPPASVWQGQLGANAHDPGVANPAVVLQYQATPANRSATYSCNYSRVSSVLFGVIHIILAAFSITGAAFIQAGEGNGADLGTGYWCGCVYLIAGVMATVGGCRPLNPVIIVIAVFSFLNIPFGIAAAVLGFLNFDVDADCDYERCVTRNVFVMAGNCAVGTVGCYQVIFGLCLHIIALRAIFKASKSQVMAVQAHYTTSVPETAHLNGSTDNQYTAATVAAAASSQHHYEPLTDDSVAGGHAYATVAGASKVGYDNEGIDRHSDKF